MSEAIRNKAVETTLMYQEAATAAQAVAEQLRLDSAAMNAIGEQIRRLAPHTVITCARGSSDHAATYAKYLLETHAGVVVSSASPSISSVYGIARDLQGCLFIAISQSGRSPDLLATVRAAASAGAVTIALCNDAEAPLVEAADFYVPLRAGPELCLAATKSYIATLAALARLVAAWTGSASLQTSIERLPKLLDRAWSLDWSAALPLLQRTQHLFVIGRGFGLGLAQEVALKFKETCALHAEAFSSAELRHGPLTLLGPEFPALIFAQNDATKAGVEALVSELTARGLPVLVAGTAAGGGVILPTLDCPAEIAPIVLAGSVYRLLATSALQRGVDPDRPPHLIKVTATL